jgi:hypothetical protein
MKNISRVSYLSCFAALFLFGNGPANAAVGAVMPGSRGWLAQWGRDDPYHEGAGDGSGPER